MSYWAAGAAVGGAALGALGSNEESIGPGDYVPNWLKDDWKTLGGQIADLQTPEFYSGQLVADQNPWMQNSLQGMADFGQPGGMGYMGANRLFGAGADFLGAGVDQINNMSANGPNTFQYDQGTYDQAFNNLSGGLQNQFDLGARNISRGFTWDMLPELNMSNALAGGQGSTKFGQAGALGQAMADQNVMQFGTNLWQNAANQANRDAMFAGNANLGSANQFDGRMLQSASMGADFLNQSYNMGQNNLNMELNAGQIQQGYDQSLIDADRERFDFEQQAPWNALNNKLALINSQKMGAPPGDTGMSWWEGALQGGFGGAGLYGAGQDAGWWGGTDFVPSPNAAPAVSPLAGMGGFGYETMPGFGGFGYTG